MLLVFLIGASERQKANCDCYVPHSAHALRRDVLCAVVALYVCMCVPYICGSEILIDGVSTGVEQVEFHLRGFTIRNLHRLHQEIHTQRLGAPTTHNQKGAMGNTRA